MLPGAVLSSTVESSAFLAPKTSTPKTALRDICLGPIAIGDSSQGSAYQDWVITTDGSTGVIFTPQTTGSPVTAMTASAPIIWVSGAFDQSGRAAVAYMDAVAAYFYWYDSLSAGYLLTILPAGATNPYICLDDTRSIESSTSDVIVTYTNANYLFFRAQRDRFGVEYNLGYIGVGTLMTQVGPNTINRFQFQFQSLVPTSILLFTKFVASRTFKPILVADATGIKPRIWKPHENVTVR